MKTAIITGATLATLPLLTGWIVPLTATILVIAGLAATRTAR